MRVFLHSSSSSLVYVYFCISSFIYIVFLISFCLRCYISMVFSSYISVNFILFRWSYFDKWLFLSSKSLIFDFSSVEVNCNWLISYSLTYIFLLVYDLKVLKNFDKTEICYLKTVASMKLYSTGFSFLFISIFNFSKSSAKCIDIYSSFWYYFSLPLNFFHVFSQFSIHLP